MNASISACLSDIKLYQRDKLIHTFGTSDSELPRVLHVFMPAYEAVDDLHVSWFRSCTIVSGVAV